MKTRICPLCDQPMRKAHHCDSCNSFIWKPLYLDIHYSTGDFHELDCSYDAKQHEYTYFEDGSVTMMPSDFEESKRKKKFRGVDEIDFPSDVSSKRSVKTSADTQKKRGGCLKKIAFIIFLLSILSSLSELVFSQIEGVGVPEPQPDVSFDEWFDQGTEEFGYSIDEVMAMGEECTGYEHMDITWDEFVSVFESEIDQTDSSISINYYDSVQNWGYDHGNDVETYFTSMRQYDLESDSGNYWANWDTYSGRLHSLDFEVYETEWAEYYFAQTMHALNQNEEECLIEFQNELNVVEDEGYVFYNTDEYEIYISYFDGENDDRPYYYISITKLIWE